LLPVIFGLHFPFQPFNPKMSEQTSTELAQPQSMEDYLATKYFPPMYEASEETIAPLACTGQLASSSKVQLDPNALDNIFTLQGVLTEQEAQWLIDRGERWGFEQSTVYSAEADDNIVAKHIRDNHRVLETFPALSTAVWNAISPHFPEEIDGKKKHGLYSLWRYYRYHPGQNFAPHQDHVVYGDELDGTESRYTFLLYLNGGSEGGETAFPKVGASVTPKVGMGLAFRHENWHEGKTVIGGMKYVIRSDVMYK
jgi:hypothetical protein